MGFPSCSKPCYWRYIYNHLKYKIKQWMFKNYSIRIPGGQFSWNPIFRSHFISGIKHLPIHSYTICILLHIYCSLFLGLSVSHCVHYDKMIVVKAHSPHRWNMECFYFWITQLLSYTGLQPTCLEPSVPLSIFLWNSQK